MAALLTIQGTVIDGSNNAPIAGVKVIARQEGTEIQQETDQDGKFTLHLVPGHWRINTRIQGFNEPDAYMYNFAADTTGIDFQLQEGYSISGQAIREDNGKPASGVVIEAEADIDGNTIRKQELTDVNGKFKFSGLQPASWQVQGALGERRTSKDVQTVGPDIYNVNLVLSRQMTEADWQRGRIFFGVLCTLLGILAGIYLWAHSRYTPNPEPELAVLISQVEQAREIAAQIKEAQEVPEPLLQSLRNTITALKENWNTVSNSIISITEGQNQQVNLLVSRAETAVMGDNPQDVDLALANLHSVFENQRSMYFWSQPPSNYLEVLFWSFAGILVSLLITSGYYLRRRMFYAEGIWMHVSHLLSVPVLALVVVFLISQIKLTVQISDSELALDISDPRLLAALSFIIAVRPWAMLDFVREAASSFFGQVQRRLSSQIEAQTQPQPPPS
jgi:flagellar biosynthesis protein FliQ